MNFKNLFTTEREPIFTPTFLPAPKRREFVLMEALLKDSHKYEITGDIDVRNALFDQLCLTIEKLKNEKL